jgi:hypothetical protein
MAASRIDRRLAALAKEGRPALVTFVTAGDPDHDTSLAIIKALPAAGADVIEMGMPFSDPMADGPASQASGQRALKGGQTLRKTLAMVRAFREGDPDTPIVLMGYYNPIYSYGNDRFLDVAASAPNFRRLRDIGGLCSASRREHRRRQRPHATARSGVRAVAWDRLRGDEIHRREVGRAFPIRLRAAGRFDFQHQRPRDSHA